MSFSDELIETHSGAWERATRHPFVQAAADRSIADGTFLRWVEQDYRFVESGIRYIGTLLEKTPERILVVLAQSLGALSEELVLFREMAEEHGAELDAVEILPANRAFQDYLVALANRGSFAENLCALWTLEKVYYESWLYVRESLDEESKWQDFIENWSSDEFAEWVEWLEDELDRAAADLSDAELERLEEVFVQTVEYEQAFWEMCWSEKSREAGG